MKTSYDSVVVEVSLEKDCMKSLMSLKDSPVLFNAKKVTFLHVYNQNTEADLPFDIKNMNDKSEVEKVIKQKMNDLKHKIAGQETPASWFTQVIYHSDAKLETLEFLKQVSADLVVVATRGGHGATGVFKNSFASYLVEYSPCDVYVIRPVH
ncbi:MAG: hypothetical protein Fur0010_19200 [Bdellovibrio sp.]